MTRLAELESYCNGLLKVDEFSDYCPNGVQVESASGEVGKIVSGVTASLALIEEARELEADLLLVHHGWFWRNEPAPLTGMKGKRLRALLAGDMALMAYHLPLDAHPTLGNNHLLGERLGFSGHAPRKEGSLVWQVELEEGITAPELASRIAQGLAQKPLHLPGGPERIRRIAWCSGGAQGELVGAAERGFDAFISGEVSENSTHFAAEMGIHYFAAGHHATERYGAQALGEHLAERFGLIHQFVDIDNPV
jgi:dinuclear metal center YbgI/SA1388 family protein